MMYKNENLLRIFSLGFDKVMDDKFLLTSFK